MKLLILSDLHLEFAAFEPQWEAARRADVVVLAGDIAPGSAGLLWARQRFPAQEIVYVAGNHEFYGGHWDTTLQALRNAAPQFGIHFLENDSVTISGMRFLGCTLWTDFAWFGAERQEASMAAVERGLNDYRRIRVDGAPDEWGEPGEHGGSSYLLRAQHTLARHLASRAWLEAQLAQDDPARTVVVTHHYPHRRSTATVYANDPLTPGFGSRLPNELLLRASLWIHGHTHASCDYRLGNSRRSVRVVCNPRGYPLGWLRNEFENPAFKAGLLVEQGPDGRWMRAEEGRHA